MSEEKTKRLELIYQDAATNLRFLKQQEWVITRYALTAYAVLVGLATQMTFRCPLLVGVVLIAVLDAVILHQFIGSMQRFRDRIDWIHKYAYPPEEQKPLRLVESDGPLNMRPQPSEKDARPCLVARRQAGAVIRRLRIECCPRHVPSAVRVCHLGARTPSPSMDRRRDQSDGGMAGLPDYRSLSLGHCSGLSHP